MAKVAVILAVFLVIFATKVEANMVEYMEYLKDILAHMTEPDPCGADTIAYYNFDRSFRDVCFGNNAVKEVGYNIQQFPGIANGAIHFRSSSPSYLRVPSLNGYEWGSKFSLSIWFKRDWNSNINSIQGLINNGPVNNVVSSSASWDIRLVTSRNQDVSIGATVVTSHSAKTWANITTTYFEHWHHLVMTYDGNTINFYLDNHLKLSDSESCHGDILTRNTDVVIGCYKNRHYNNRYYKYFKGYIDEVKLFKKALNGREVTKLYQLKNV